MDLSRADAAAGNPDEALRVDPFNWPALMQRSGVVGDARLQRDVRFRPLFDVWAS